MLLQILSHSFYGWVLFHYVSIHIHIHIHYIYSSVDGYLGCLYVLAVINNAAMNTGVHISFQIRVFPDTCTGVGLLDYMATLISKGTSILFSIVPVPIYIPINNVGRFPFLHIVSSLIICRLFNDGHSDRCEVVSHCTFDLHFFNN